MADHQLNQMQDAAFACTSQAQIPIIRAVTDHQLNQSEMSAFRMPNVGPYANHLRRGRSSASPNRDVRLRMHIPGPIPVIRTATDHQLGQSEMPAFACVS